MIKDFVGCNVLNNTPIIRRSWYILACPNWELLHGAYARSSLCRKVFWFPNFTMYYLLRSLLYGYLQNIIYKPTKVIPRLWIHIHLYLESHKTHNIYKSNMISIYVFGWWWCVVFLCFFLFRFVVFFGGGHFDRWQLILWYGIGCSNGVSVLEYLLSIYRRTVNNKRPNHPIQQACSQYLYFRLNTRQILVYMFVEIQKWNERLMNLSQPKPE